MEQQHKHRKALLIKFCYKQLTKRWERIKNELPLFKQREARFSYK